MGYTIENCSNNNAFDLITKLASAIISQSYPDKLVICYVDKTNKLTLSSDIKKSINYILSNGIEIAYIQHSSKINNMNHILPIMFNPDPLLPYEQKERELMNIIDTMCTKI